MPADWRLFRKTDSILISVMTYELVKEFFDCEYYGKLPVKYKGDLQMYRVKGLKPEFSVDGQGSNSKRSIQDKIRTDTIY